MTLTHRMVCRHRGPIRSPLLLGIAVAGKATAPTATTIETMLTHRNASRPRRRRPGTGSMTRLNTSCTTKKMETAEAM